MKSGAPEIGGGGKIWAFTRRSLRMTADGNFAVVEWPQELAPHD